VPSDPGTVSVQDLDVGGLADGVPSLVRAFRCDRPFEPPARILLDGVKRAVLGRGDLAITRQDRDLVVTVPDDRMSTVHARLVRSDRGFELEDNDSKNGTLVNGRRCARIGLHDGDVIETGHTFFVYRTNVPHGVPATPSVFAEPASSTELALTTFLPSLAWQFERLERVAASHVAVVVLGDTGTGKEAIARALHRMSGRSGALISLNCGAIPATLIESELFGVRKGAFSGATGDRPGLIRAASGGTLFLDEIGELPAPAQIALLRVLQEQEVMPIGATQPVKVDVRLVAATHQALDRMVDVGSFRADLMARLGGLKIRLPLLRERREDLGLIIQSLLRRIGAAEHLQLSRRAARAVFLYSFPHNVRELEKALGLAAMIVESNGIIELEHLPEELWASEHGAPGDLNRGEPGASDEQRKARLLALLAQHRGQVAAVARAMGKARMQIHRWIDRYDIDLASFRK
jgi:transcriptional regulator of acetoin/glycerol metabolism